MSILDGVFAVPYATLTSGPLLTLFLLALGATEFQIGLVAAFPLLAGLVQPLGAEVIRRRGGWRRPVSLAGAGVDLLLWGVSLGAVLLLEPQTALLVILGVLALQQMATAFTSVAWTSWMSDLVPARLRGRYFGRRNFVCNTFGFVSALGAGWVLEAAGQDVLSVFLWIIAFGLVLRGVSLYFLRRQPELGPARSAEGRFFEQLTQPIASPGFRPFLLYVVLWGFSVQLAAPFFTVYMIREAGVSTGAVMLFAGLGTAANLAGQRFWGPLCDRLGDRPVMRAAGLIVVLQPLWWLFTSGSGAGYYLMPLLSIIGGFAWGGHLLATGNLMMRLAPALGKTSFFAVQAALGGLAGALGPIAGGLLAAPLANLAASLPPEFFTGLKALFFVSFGLRLLAWGALQRVPAPVRRPHRRATYLLRDTVRTFNLTQGFSPLLHVFMPAEQKRGKREG